MDKFPSFLARLTEHMRKIDQKLFTIQEKRRKTTEAEAAALKAELDRRAEILNPENDVKNAIFFSGREDGRRSKSLGEKVSKILKI